MWKHYMDITIRHDLSNDVVTVRRQQDVHLSGAIGYNYLDAAYRSAHRRR